METIEQVKERPILFNGDMVRVILDGRKTQTRRVVKQSTRKDGCKLLPGLLREIGIGEACPYGKPGDRLWVRETWQALRFIPDHVDGRENGYGDFEPAGFIPKSKDGWSVDYAATSDFAEYHIDDRGYGYRPSIHMPRWASRILLEITDVRVERVQDISEADMMAEGIPSYEFVCGILNEGWTRQKPFEELWNAINGKRGYGWDENPYVWVIEFNRIEP